jgi:hypothetical protein
MLMVQTANARPDSYVPDHQWKKAAWQCRKAGKSSIEIESLRLPTKFVAGIKVVDLRINGRKVDPRSIQGLDDFVGTLDAVDMISGRCGWTGEYVFVRGFQRALKKSGATEEKEFFIRYVR